MNRSIVVGIMLMLVAPIGADAQSDFTMAAEDGASAVVTNDLRFFLHVAERDRWYQLSPRGHLINSGETEATVAIWLAPGPQPELSDPADTLNRPEHSVFLGSALVGAGDSLDFGDIELTIDQSELDHTFSIEQDSMEHVGTHAVTHMIVAVFSEGPLSVSGTKALPQGEWRDFYHNVLREETFTPARDLYPPVDSTDGA
ncbi:hypothetical protein BH23BAC4_BH23BAC4_17470 [soil metagenome]